MIHSTMIGNRNPKIEKVGSFSLKGVSPHTTFMQDNEPLSIDLLWKTSLSLLVSPGELVGCGVKRLVEASFPQVCLSMVHPSNNWVYFNPRVQDTSEKYQKE